MTQEDPIVAMLRGGSGHAGEACLRLALRNEIQASQSTLQALQLVAGVMGGPTRPRGQAVPLRAALAEIDPALIAAIDGRIAAAVAAYRLWLQIVGPLRPATQRAQTHCKQSHARVSRKIVSTYAGLAVMHQRLAASTESLEVERDQRAQAAGAVRQMARGLSAERWILGQRSQAIEAARAATPDPCPMTGVLVIIAKADMAWRRATGAYPSP